MPSYQDLETRLRVVEDRLNFVMSSLRMKAASPNGLLNADGSPSYSVFEGSLLELYHMSNQLPVVKQTEEPNGPVSIPADSPFNPDL